MILQNANEQLSKEIKKIKLCKESIMKSKSIIQMSIDGKRRVLGISPNKLEKKKGELLSKKKRLRRYVNGKGSLHNGNT